MKTPKTADILQTLNPSKIILPIAIGLGVVIFLMIRNIDVTTFQDVNWSWWVGVWLGFGVLLVIIRHLILMYRIRSFTDNKLSWRQSFDVISLWEFGSAATPSVVGGTAIALFLLTKEKIKAGETIAVILFTVFLDSLFLISLIPFLWLALGKGLLSPAYAMPEIQQGTFWVYPFFIGYLIMTCYTLAIGYGLFIKPHGFKWFITKMTSFSFLKRWHESAKQTGDDIIVASGELKKKDAQFWMTGIVSTGLIWSIRFLILNCVLAAFAEVSSHLMLFGRQILIYVLMLLAPTPGGSGIAEIAFRAFLSDFFLQTTADGTQNVNEGLWVVVAAVWRMITYYSYLILGVVVLPNWLRRVFKNIEN